MWWYSASLEIDVVGGFFFKMFGVYSVVVGRYLPSKYTHSEVQYSVGYGLNNKKLRRQMETDDTNLVRE